MARLYFVCCGYRALWRRPLFWCAVFLITITITSWLSSSNVELSVDIYVVEEHHEALRYWHHAAVIKRINRTGNTLVHIDAHSDMAAPEFIKSLPIFSWPIEEQLFGYLQRNDVFIQGAAIIGMLDHIIWIYPSWDKNTEFDDYDVFLFEIGLFSTATLAGGNTVFCECHTPVDKHTHQIADGEKAECSYLDTKTRSSAMEVNIEKSQCHIKRRLIFEVIVDGLALEVLKASAWLNKPSNVILDIDEDYFGCERGGTPLETVMPWPVVERLDDLTADLICAKNPIHEEAGDRILKDLIADFAKTCQLTSGSTCNISTDVILEHVREPALKQFHFMPRMFCHDEATTMRLIHKTIDTFKRLTYAQLKALAELGFCLNTSPVTVGFHDGNAKFKVCHGANTPNDTVVTIYTPDEDEVSRRMSMLWTILEHITDLKPNIVTVCRSVRDGFTPRHLVSQIESGILDFFAQSDNKLKYNVIFDDNLLGGKEGWHGRHKTHFP